LLPNEVDVHWSSHTYPRVDSHVCWGITPKSTTLWQAARCTIPAKAS
jgi:hypothetical protein